MRDYKKEYRRNLELYPDYIRVHRLRQLQLHPDFDKIRYERMKEMYPDYLKMFYQRCIQLHPDYVKKKNQRQLEMHPDLNKQKYRREVELHGKTKARDRMRKWRDKNPILYRIRQQKIMERYRLRKKIFNTLNSVKNRGRRLR